MKTISRRNFLKGSLAAAGMTIAASITPFGIKLLNAKELEKAVFAPSAFFEVTSDNLVTVSIPNSEMGQGVRTALSMIVADELEADWSQIRVKQAPARDPYKNPVFGAQVTVGSASVRGFYEPLRKAGAAGRMMLVKAAAETWKIPEGECEIAKGVVKNKKNGRTLTFGQLCQKASVLPIPQDPVLKKESEFRYIGKDMARLDIPDKVAGTAVYGLDVNVPDMLIAVIARSPVYGAKPGEYDEKAALAIKGVQKVAPTPNGIAVIADSTAAALKGRDALKVQWGAGSHPDMNDESIEKHFMEGLDKQGAVVAPATKGNAKTALAEAKKNVEAVYYVPFVAHATMEPLNCTAYVQPDRCDIWVPTQTQTGTLMTAAGLTKLPPDKVHVHTTLLGCGFGRRARTEWVVDAVSASKAVGKPVKVVWTREEDLQNHFFRAGTCQKLQAGLDAQGQVVGWSHKVACSSILRFSNPAGIKDGVDGYSLMGIYDGEKSPTLTKTAYEFPTYYLEQWLSDLPIPVCPWRSVQNAPNAFITECFLDELARAAGKDPVEFRLPLLANHMRARRVLQTVAEKAGWGKPMAKGKGRGIAQHTCFGTSTAQVAEISVNEATGTFKVDRVVVAVDCGPVINPGPLVAQIQSGVLLALSTVLKEVIHFDKGGVKTSNFHDYNILRMSQAPEIEVHVVPSTEKIGGIGELGVPALAPAVANALFNATGARVRRLPLEPKYVLEALKSKSV